MTGMQIRPLIALRLREMAGLVTSVRQARSYMFPGEYALAIRIHHPSTVYLREAE